MEKKLMVIAQECNVIFWKNPGSSTLKDNSSPKRIFMIRFKKCTEGYELSKSQEKISHLYYMDDIKLVAKNEKELESNTNNKIIYLSEIVCVIFQEIIRTHF